MENVEQVLLFSSCVGDSEEEPLSVALGVEITLNN
jgi:hypothetical protein